MLTPLACPGTMLLLTVALKAAIADDDSDDIVGGVIAGTGAATNCGGGPPKLGDEVAGRLPPRSVPRPRIASSKLPGFGEAEKRRPTSKLAEEAVAGVGAPRTLSLMVLHTALIAEVTDEGEHDIGTTRAGLVIPATS
mmetsp:Transcript_41678/g.73164  ORF Transcript_41678/g.73164 Transcript_41678/m.73164 type:complete len:138 (+) Transcript_41678:866-1279(+)